MATAWFEKFITLLEKLILYPPYLVFIFVSAPVLMISLITRNWTEQIWIFFLYSSGGVVWRYIERDFLSALVEVKNSKVVIIGIYHIGNILLFIGLLHYLKLV